MDGKTKCRILRKIRQRIADENHIPFHSEECTHEGDCFGTCPLCEAELRFLEEKLRERQSRGSPVLVPSLYADYVLDDRSLTLGDWPEVFHKDMTDQLSPPEQASLEELRTEQFRSRQILAGVPAPPFDPDGDPDGEPDRPKSWFSRLFRRSKKRKTE